MNLPGGLMQVDKSVTSVSLNAMQFQKMPEIIQPPLVEGYMDFRKYLADFYSYKKEITKNNLRPYNYAVFSAAADIKSPNYLKMIIDGKRNLSPDMVAKFSKALNHSKDQADDFKILVEFGQTTDPAERNFYLKKLNEMRVNAQLKNGTIDKKTWDKVPNWVAWILYSMIDQEGVNFTPEKMREQLRGKATAQDVQEAMDILLASGEIQKDEVTGEIKKARTLIDSADDIPVALVRKLQAQLMYLGLESLFQDNPTEREFGSLTLALTKAEFEQLKFQLRKIRKEINKENSIKRMGSKGDRVYQLNLQLFPVTDKVT